MAHYKVVPGHPAHARRIDRLSDPLNRNSALPLGLGYPTEPLRI